MKTVFVICDSCDCITILKSFLYGKWKILCIVSLLHDIFLVFFILSFPSIDFATKFIKRRGNSRWFGVSSGATNQRGASERETTTTTSGHQRRRKSSSGTSKKIEFYSQNKEGTTHKALWFSWNRRGMRQLCLIRGMKSLPIFSVRRILKYSARKSVYETRNFFSRQNVVTLS